MAAPTIQKALSGVASNVSSNGFAYNYTGYTGANTLAVVAISVVAKNTTLINVTSVTDTNTGMVYHKYTDKSFVSVNDGNLLNALACKLEVWYAYGTVSSTTGTLTVNLDGTADGLAVAGNIFTGANSQPFDNGGVETWQNDNPAATVNGISHRTNTANTCMMWAAMSPSIPTGLSSYNNLDVTYGGVAADNTTALGSTFNSFGWVWCLLSEKAYTSVQSGVAYAGTHSLFNQIGIAFAITADSAPPVDPDLTYYNHNASGDRRSTITVTTSRADFFLNRDDGTNAASSGTLGNILPMLVDGYPTPTVNVNPALPHPPYPFSLAINPGLTAGDWIKFHFDVAEKMQGFFTKGSADWNNGVGVWQWYGSNDDTTYYALGGSFTWENDQNNWPGASNASYYTYYKLQMVSGTVSGTGYTDAPIQTEFEFQLIESGETPVVTTAYTNLFGSDDREPNTVVVTTNLPGGDYAGNVGNLVSGSTGGSDTNNAIIMTTGGVTSNGIYFEFQFPRATIVEELTLYQSGSFDEGDFNLDVSNNGSSWTTLTSFTWDQLVTVVGTGNRTDKFKYLRIIGTNAAKNFSVFPWLFEAQFKTNTNGPIEIGDRHTLITVTTTLTVNTGTIQNIVNGDETANNVTFNDSNVTGHDLTFDFGSFSYAIEGMQFVLSSNSDNYGNYKAQWWDGAAWNDISGATFALGGVSPPSSVPVSQSFTWSNTNSGTKFRILGTSGTNNDGGNAIHQVNLFVAPPSTNHWTSVETTDTFHGVGYPGYPGPHGDLTVTEAKDVFAAAGYQPANGSLIATEATDVFHGFLKQPISGTLVVTEAKDVFHGTGIGRGEDGTLITTEAKDVMVAHATTPIVATMHPTERADRFLALGVGVSRVRRRRQTFVT